MSIPSDAIPSLSSVEGVFQYMGEIPEKPFQYTMEPPAGRPRSNYVLEKHAVPVWDARPVEGRVSLDREGFALVPAPTAVRDFYDEDEVRRVAYPEAERLVAALTGATRVHIFDHTIRRRLADVEDRTHGQPRQPVTRVHNDYTPVSGPQRVRDLFPDEADDLLKRRFAIVNIWRPIRGPLYDAPLALCDARSMHPGDFIATDLIYPDRKGEIYTVRYSPDHRWYYFRAMERDEAVLIKCYDSLDGVAAFTAHSAFDDPTTPEGAAPRESIELRSIAFF